MGVDQIWQAAAQFGAMGLLVMYLVWREKAEREDRKEAAKERAEIEKADVASRLELARSLTMLSMVIQGKPNV